MRTAGGSLIMQSGARQSCSDTCDTPIVAVAMLATYPASSLEPRSTAYWMPELVGLHGYSQCVLIVLACARLSCFGSLILVVRIEGNLFQSDLPTLCQQLSSPRLECYEHAAAATARCFVVGYRL